MTCWPVIQRELREGARRGATYWLRVTGALAGLVVFGVTMGVLSFEPVTVPHLARLLFCNIQTALFSAIWGLVPFLTSDTLSRERREGTLGLLLLTPLKPFEVVVGKAMAQSLRALTIVIAVFPVLTIPMLLGGVNGWEFGLAVMADAASLALALAAGLLASAWTRQWNRAALAGAATAFVALALLGSACAIGFEHYVLNITKVRQTFPSDLPWWLYPPGGVVLLSGAGGLWNLLSTSFPLSTGRWLTLHSGLVAFAVGSAALFVWLAAWRVRSFSSEEASLNHAQPWLRAFLEPMFWRRVFRSRMRRSLDRNPIGWLQQHRTLARVSKWGWALFLVLSETFLLYERNWDSLPWVQMWLGILLLVSLVLSACGSFRRERETGALELLLVTPLRPRQLVFGRVRGLWAQFLPAFALVTLPLAFWRPTYSTAWYDDTVTLGYWMPVWLVGAFAGLPVTGLYYSLKCRTTVGAAALCLAMGGVVPVVVGCLSLLWIYLVVLDPRVATEPNWGWALALSGLASVGMAGRCLIHLVRSLAQRRFKFH